LFGHTSDARSMQPVEAVSVCAPPMVQALTQLVSMRPLLRGTGAAGQQQGGHLRSQLAAMLDRGVLKLTKTQCQVQKEHPWWVRRVAGWVGVPGHITSSIQKLQP
jgi:hypothetical protein